MHKKEITFKYLEYLDHGMIEQVIELFNEDGIVDSTRFGIRKTNEFYHDLNNDTANSELNLLGVFEEENTSKIALYISYKWTL